MRRTAATAAVLLALALAACEMQPNGPPDSPPPDPAPPDTGPRTWSVQMDSLTDWPGARATVDGEERIGGDAIANALAFLHRPDVGPVDGDRVVLQFSAGSPPWSSVREYNSPLGWLGEDGSVFVQPGTWTVYVDSGASFAAARKTIGGRTWTGKQIPLAVAYQNRPTYGPTLGDVVTVNSPPGIEPSWSVSVMYTSRGW